MQKYNDPVDIQRPITVKFSDGYALGEFHAMASPCQILLDTLDLALAQKLTAIAAHECWRIEQKYSRYRQDGIIPRINNSQGIGVSVDIETAFLIDFAFQCYAISDGMFDITSGVLRRAWKFDGSDNVPAQKQIDALIPLIGLTKCQWVNNTFTLPSGMEIDVGGIGKEYAVDRVLQCLQEQCLQEHSALAMLVNFGGDIAAAGKRTNNQSWRVGIESASHKAKEMLSIDHGGIATSGDANRFLLKNGRRYSHILNPKTGWPVANAPSSVTVISNTCTEAGILSTMAMLQGKGAEKFLRQQDVKFWVQR